MQCMFFHLHSLMPGNVAKEIELETLRVLLPTR